LAAGNPRVVPGTIHLRLFRGPIGVGRSSRAVSPTAIQFALASAAGRGLNPRRCSAEPTPPTPGVQKTPCFGVLSGLDQLLVSLHRAMTVTGKFSLIIFLVLPVGFFGSLILLQGHDPWALIAVITWIIFSMFLLRSLRCPRCHSRVYQMRYWPLSRMDLYELGIILRRCGGCGCALDSDEKAKE
jgi:hypothetical protein